MRTGVDAPDLRPAAEALATVGGSAPSLHDAQPWMFRVARDHVDVLLDRGRLLPVTDPTTRQAQLGLGAAVLLLRLQLAAAERAVRVPTGNGTAGRWRSIRWSPCCTRRPTVPRTGYAPGRP
jgi:hypothetical protein